MTAGDRKFAGLAFALLTASVGANLFAFQETRRSSAVETSAIAPRQVPGGAATAAATTQPAVLRPSDTSAPARGGIMRIALPGETVANSAEMIRGIQRELNTRGYDAGQPDGVAGLVTRAAIMAYEYDYGLALTGTPSQELLSRVVLGSAAASARPRGRSEVTAEGESLVRVAEQSLAGLGYRPGKIDGRFDEQTARAIREFELDQKLAESGRISGPMMSRLLRLQGQSTPPLTPALTPGLKNPAARAAQK